MPNAVLHGFDPPWTSSDPAVLGCEPGPAGRGMRLHAAAGAAGATVRFSPSAPLDLSSFDELRLWSTSDGPQFPLELAFTSGADVHRWLVPGGGWAQHRLGMAGDQRTAVTEFSLRCLADGPFTVDLDELLAVREEPLLDAEAALIQLLTEPIALPGGPVAVPVLPEDTPSVNLPDPVLLLALTDQREEPERGWNIPQRDSFRDRGGRVVCSVRPPARPILLEYQVLAVASDREQSLLLRQAVLQRVGVDTGLRVNGAVLPVRTLVPPPLSGRDRTVLAPIFLHIGARLELGERREVPWVRSAVVNAGQLPRTAAKEDDEGIVLQL